MLLLVKNPWWKWKRETVRCPEATASSFVTKVQGEVFTHFHTVAVKCHSSMRNWLFGLSGWILCEQSPWCQRKLWACSWFCFSPASPFMVSVSLEMPFKHLCTAHAFFPEHLSNRCHGFHLTFSEICTKFDAVYLLDPSWNCMRPDTRLQGIGHKWLSHPSRCLRYASTIIYCCIALLQLLYKWQHQSWKLWLCPEPACIVHHYAQSKEEKNRCLSFSNWNWKLSVFIYTLHNEDIWRSGVIDPHILNHDTRCMWVSEPDWFTLQKSFWYPLGSRLVGLQCLFVNSNLLTHPAK
jgi:hypothetical protein